MQVKNAPKMKLKISKTLSKFLTTILKVMQFGFCHLFTIFKRTFIVEKLQIILNVTCCPTHRFQRVFPRTIEAKVYINNKTKSAQIISLYSYWKVGCTWYIACELSKNLASKHDQQLFFFLTCRHPCNLKIRSRSSETSCP